MGRMQSSRPASSEDIDSQRILSEARLATHPLNWYVWPLRRDRVQRAALGWAVIGLFGFVLFIPLVLATVPSNFQGGFGSAAATIILLGLVGAVAFGGLGMLISDLRRLARADEYLLVITPEHYLRAEPGRVTYVPMTAVAYVTLKGVRLAGAPQRDTISPLAQASVGRFGALGSMMGSGYRREMRRPPSLAFLDTRTQSQVVVATDDAFEDLPVLQEVLNLYAGGVGLPRR